MPFLMIRNDITKVVADAIVNPANREKIVAALEKAMAVIDQERSSRSQNLLIREKLEAVVPIIENGFINLILFQDDPGAKDAVRLTSGEIFARMESLSFFSGQQ